MDQYAGRKYVVSMIIMIVGLIFLIRLFFIQVVNPTYKLSAESNTRRMEILYPARGLIYDRNKVLIAQNQPTYDLKIAPSELQPFDSLLLCQILNIDIHTLREGIKKVKERPEERRNAFIKQLPPEIYARLKEKQYLFPGFYFSIRTLRKYERQIACHLLGYVGEVDSANIKENAYYEMGDYFGVSGIESTYEQYLRGVKGRKYTLIDVHGREKGPYKEGKYNTTAEPGKNITLTINADLQAYGELLMHNFKGSIVAIDPKTGEVLALVIIPNYLLGMIGKLIISSLAGTVLNLFTTMQYKLYIPLVAHLNL
jgi:penicillin-binding protein 2